MKIYVWIDKRLYFHNMETKKFEKKKLVRVLNPLVQNHIRARVVDFFVAGHILAIIGN